MLAAYLLVAVYFTLAEVGSKVLPPPEPPALARSSDAPPPAPPVSLTGPDSERVAQR